MTFFLRASGKASRTERSQLQLWLLKGWQLPLKDLHKIPYWLSPLQKNVICGLAPIQNSEDWFQLVYNVIILRDVRQLLTLDVNMNLLNRFNFR